jgi:aspartate ammonia-lyase
MRKEHDALGYLDVPDDAYYGIQTARNCTAFDIGPLTLDDFPDLISAVAKIKVACARANCEIGALDPEKSAAIEKAAREVIEKKFYYELPVNIFRGSGTPLNAGVNEIIAHRANEILSGDKAAGGVHPSTHVNMAQSSNDVIPTAKTIVVWEKLDAVLTGLDPLIAELKTRGEEFAGVIKMGRTGIQDAVPITLGQQLRAFAHGLERSRRRLAAEKENASHSCLGGTAVGTGMGCLPGFRSVIHKHLSAVLGRTVEAYPDLVDGMMAIDDVIACHGEIVALSAQVWKLARDLRLMASGPNSGLREITFALSDPTEGLYPERYASNGLERVISACNQVAANNSGVLFGLKNGWLDLGACSSIPLRSLISSSDLLVSSMRLLAETILPAVRCNQELCRKMAESSASNSTMISTIFGYEMGSKVAHLALDEGLTCREAAKKLAILPDAVIDDLFDVRNLTDPDRMEALFHKYKAYRKV